MYAVIETGGKQYRVEVGTELEVELLDVEPGQAITLDRVLLVADGADAAVGRPVVADAAVEAEVVRRERGDKLIAFKYRPKARRRVRKGHRQELTVLRIADIRFNGKSAAESRRRAEHDAKTERERLEEAAARQAAADAALAATLAEKEAAERPRSRRTAKPEAGAAAEPEQGATAEAAPEAAAEPPATRKSRAKATPTSEPAGTSEASEKSETSETGGTAEAEAGTSQKPAPKRSRAKKDE